GQQTVIDYAIEIDSSSSFNNAREIGRVSNTTSLTFSVGQFNDAVSGVGLAPFTWDEVYVRVISSIGDAVEQPSTSNTIVFEVFPFFSYPFEDFYLVGDATPPNWNNNFNNPLLFRSSTNPDRYTYTGLYNPGAFKILEVRGQWQPQWGTNDNGATLESSADLGGDPGVLTVPTGGDYYTVTVNFNEGTFSSELFSGDTSNPPSSVTISGSAVVGGPISLESISSGSPNYSFDDPHIWYISTVELGVGDLQFNANGTDAWGGTTEFSGVATQGGGSVPVVVGDDYEVWFNSLTGDYIMRPINLSSN
ncbi:MAG: SusF/SusE family outer membrane protein, partial [Bacteroidota bacterium]